MKPHKHAELIKAWADGAEIQINSATGWIDLEFPGWGADCEYRIKPEPKPDIIEYWQNTLTNCGQMDDEEDANLKLTFDGETGELKSAEVLK